MIRINKELLNYVNHLYQLGTEGNIIEQTFEPTEQIIKSGQNVFSVYVIKSGMAKCYLTEDTGNDFIQEFFAEGEIFGEIEAIREDISFCTIEASSPLVLYKIPLAYFNELLLKNNVFNRLILKALANKINYKAIRHSYNQSHPVESKLLRLKANFPDFNKLLPKQEIANYLGITVRSLNRTLNDLKAKGLIS
ncbi:MULTISPECIES: Crp/Fnr family transcriptional regulator [unclassified Arcicella]|uniref:Crp/Fnr family transcriptional regulator n=1 Tax=unclassified Arcicella TaxID=2644986 RepID=UPI00285A7822|nr:MULTISPECIES: Crp/Fnr family transcriptional regulator [unclassified Arcicella]MDR6562439.1 CRP-like cAMP-binding protein [Arcicella sp. BE51]MDR6812333.1 CRP-like cAMP-binding protein [Arcicella sp. BE140]MDR6823503.1 CRP-like cAMP-binding protein [Arcicella sp. BE139]